MDEGLAYLPMGDEVEKRLTMTRLMDVYGGLLTERQLVLMKQSLEDDLSLSEIALQTGTSRQAVHDSIRRAEQQLCLMEQKIGCIRDRLRVRQLARRLLNALQLGMTDEARTLAEVLLSFDVEGEDEHGL